jgi:hypothetical protein
MLQCKAVPEHRGVDKHQHLDVSSVGSNLMGNQTAAMVAGDNAVALCARTASRCAVLVNGSAASNALSDASRAVSRQCCWHGQHHWLSPSLGATHTCHAVHVLLRAGRPSGTCLATPPTASQHYWRYYLAHACGFTTWVILLQGGAAGPVWPHRRRRPAGPPQRLLRHQLRAQGMVIMQHQVRASFQKFPR